MAELVKQSNYDGSNNNTYKIDISPFESKNHQLIACYAFCKYASVFITDIIVEFINKNTGYNVAWQSCVWYSKDDFDNSFKGLCDFLKEHDNNKFDAWCVTFKIDEIEYTISGKVNKDVIRLWCVREIPVEMIEMINWLERQMREMDEIKGENE